MNIKDFDSVSEFCRLTQNTGAEGAEKVFCCDLLSMAMSCAPANSAWVTVMANINTIAVAELRDVFCIVFAEGRVPDETCIARAEENGIALFTTPLPVFEAAQLAHSRL